MEIHIHHRVPSLVGRIYLEFPHFFSRVLQEGVQIGAACSSTQYSPKSIFFTFCFHSRSTTLSQPFTAVSALTTAETQIVICKIYLHTLGTLSVPAVGFSDILFQQACPAPPVREYDDGRLLLGFQACYTFAHSIVFAFCSARKAHTAPPDWAVHADVH